MATAVRVGDTEYLLAAPSLTAGKWEELLEPFLSTELLHVRQTDFCQTLSIFAPISDAMERAGLAVGDVHFVLMAGGSALIPQVQWAVEKYFPQARVLTFPDSTAAQTAIARGAAWSAAWLEATGQPFVRPVISDAIALRVRGRSPITLIDAGSPIPFPADGSWATKPGLLLPKPFNGLLKVEIVTLPDEQTVLHMPAEMDKKLGGEPLLLQYRSYLRWPRLSEAPVGGRLGKPTPPGGRDAFRRIRIFSGKVSRSLLLRLCMSSTAAVALTSARGWESRR